MTKSRGNRDKFGSLERNRCEIVLTSGPQHKGIKVRCYCMAPHGANINRCFRYDALGVVDTLKDATELWRTHVRDQLTRVAGVDIVDMTKGSTGEDSTVEW